MKVFNKDVWFGGQKIVDDFAERHKVGFCTMPKSISYLAMPFSASVAKAVPLSVLNLGSATKVEDQGSTPQCAAYSASSYAESILWRKTGSLPREVDPQIVYMWAKQYDGDPDGDGTTLVAVLDGLKALGYIDSDCQTRTVMSPFDVKSAIHRYGFCLLGLNITDEWYRGNRDITSTTARFVGGHAVLCVGYDQEGVWILNSWGPKWGQGGFAHIGWHAFNKQFMYGAFADGVYRDMV